MAFRHLSVRIFAITCLLGLAQWGGLPRDASADEVAGAEVSLPEPETIVLISGDKITGVIVSSDESGVVMDHPVLGRITIPGAEIAIEEPAPENPGLFGTSFLRGATRTIGFGMSGATGNTDNLGMSATLAISKETERHRANFGSAYLLGTESGNTTQNQFFARYLHDLLFPGSNWLLYGNARFDYDELRSWDERIAAGAGAGYQIWKDDRFDLIGRLGVGFSKTFDTGAAFLAVDPTLDDVKPELQVGVQFGWTIVEGMSFNVSNLYAPNLQEMSEFRNITNVGYRIDLGIVRGLSFNVGLENEYISNSPPGTEKNDFKYITTLAYDL